MVSGQFQGENDWNIEIDEISPFPKPLQEILINHHITFLGISESLASKFTGFDSCSSVIQNSFSIDSLILKNFVKL